jgi:hypothetical protein
MDTLEKASPVRTASDRVVSVLNTGHQRVVKTKHPRETPKENGNPERFLVSTKMEARARDVLTRAAFVGNTKIRASVNRDPVSKKQKRGQELAVSHRKENQARGV